MKEKHIRENTTMFTQLNTRHLSLALALARVTLISDRRRSKTYLLKQLSQKRYRFNEKHDKIRNARLRNPFT